MKLPVYIRCYDSGTKKGRPIVVSIVHFCASQLKGSFDYKKVMKKAVQIVPEMTSVQVRVALARLVKQKKLRHPKQDDGIHTDTKRYCNA